MRANERETKSSVAQRLLHVLIVEDNPSDAELILHELHRSGFDPVWRRVDTEKEYLEHLSPSLDIILSDFSLPQLDARRALLLLKNRGLDVPFIVVSGTIGEETAIRTIQEGASDYILKDRLSRLGVAIDNAINGQVLRRQHLRTVDDLKKSEEMYRSLIHSARDAIMTISTGGTITSLNPAFKAVTGWAPGQWIGRSVFDLIHDDEINFAEGFFRLTVEGTTSPIHEFRIRTQSDAFISGEITASPQLVNGKAIGVLCIFRDISEKKMFEEQLREAQRLESLGTLAGGIAHDINNILGIILGYTELLKDPTIPAERHGPFIENILKAIARGSKVVQQVLTFARRDELAPSTIQVNDVARELSKMLEETMPKIIDISITLDESIPPALIDGNQFHQALLNLCVNARDAIFDSEKGEDTHGMISITTGAVSGDTLRRQHADAVAENYVRISVGDTGSGMDAETQKRIFDPFFTTKERGKGTGLGLAVVYGIVGAHGGFIDVESELHHGTVFNIYLPVSARAINAGWPQAGADAAPLIGSETILLVEDEEPLMQLMKLFLESNGYTVLTASDGIAAVDVYAHYAGDISLVLSDVGLPTLGGVAVIQRIREITPTIPAILASGYLTDQQRAEAVRLGIGRIISKPYQPNVVLTTIRGMLDEARRQPAPDE
jgi:PAS domain S-box-containing protein